MSKTAKTLGKMLSAQRTAELNPTHIKDLVPDPTNRRRHNPRNIGMVVDALHRVGAARSIVVDEDNVVLAGNGVLEAAAEAGITRVRVVDVDGSELVAVRRSGLSADDKRALAIYDNRAGELAEWNPEQLQADVAAGLDLKPWFSEEELAKVLGQPAPKDGLTDPDAVPAVRATDIRLGDLFELGGHLLLCGDSTKAEDVRRVMNGAELESIVTSPPYNQDLGSQSQPTGMHADNAWFKRLSSSYADAMPEDDYQASQVAMMSLWFGVVRPGGSCFYNHKHRYRERRPIIPLDWIRLTKWELRQEIIWDRRGGVAANARMFVPGDERIYWLEKPGLPNKWNGEGQNRTTVWPISPQANDGDHVCPYPVELITLPLMAVTDTGDIIGDPFCGSGTTMIGCEQTGRICRAVELEPRYVQVAIDRFEAFTGQKATKVGEAVLA